MAWDEFPSWFRRRRRWPFFDVWSTEIDDVVRDMDKMMQNMFKEFADQIPENLVRERKLSDGSTFKEMGPFVWGWSMTMGPEGKPVIREFGNLKPSTSARPWESPFKIRGEREPFVDVIEDDNKVRVIAELPGVEKRDIELRATEKTLVISVDKKERKYYKQLELPSKVNPSKAKSTYKNGVLEVELKKVEDKPSGVRIDIK
ncbi:MAG TPA: Hsp20/alpha crystallin family protein [Candidatus Bathyarchaeota archaeon]|nr:Hsp20/alpha crystallin family protein [Candidatus Bathyarchaeota archaeon]